MTLPRILTAVPPLPHMHLEIAKAIRTLAPSGDRHPEQHDELARVQSHRELMAEIVRDAWRILGKTGYDPNEPRVPAGNPDGGQWTDDGGNSSSSDQRVLSDETPDNTWIAGAQYAANDQLESSNNRVPPDIPQEKPTTPQAVNTFLKVAAYFLAGAVLAGEPAGDFILALEAVD